LNSFSGETIFNRVTLYQRVALKTCQASCYSDSPHIANLVYSVRTIPTLEEGPS